MLRILTPWDSQPQEVAELKSEFGPVSGWLGSSPFAALPVGRADPLFSSGVLDVGIGGQGALFNTNGSQRVQIPGAVSPGAEFIAVVVYENTTANTSGIIMAGKTNFSQSNGFMFSSKTNVNTLEINGGNGATFPTIAATGAGAADGAVKTVVVRYRGTSADVFLNGVSCGTVTIAAAGTWPSGLGIGNYSGTGGGNLPNRRFYMGAVVRYGDPLQLSADPRQLFAPRSIWVPVSAGGGSASTITAAAGVATASALAASSTAASTPTAAAGTATASTVAASSTAASAITSATGAATALTLTGSAVVAGAITAAAGVGTGGTLAGDTLAAGSAAIVAAGGVATAATLGGSSVAAAAIGVAAGAATASVMGGPGAEPVARLFAGGFPRREQFRKGYIIKGVRYWLTEEELAVMVAQMLAEISRGDIKQVTAGKPKTISKKTWDAIQIEARIEAVAKQFDDTDEDEDESILMML